MGLKVILSPRAIQDLQEIVRYIALDDPTRAERFGFALLDRTQLLSSFPQIGRVVPETRDDTFREVIYKSYRIIYRVNDRNQVIEVSRFWHAARGTPFLPPYE